MLTVSDESVRKMNGRLMAVERDIAELRKRFGVLPGESLLHAIGGEWPADPDDRFFARQPEPDIAGRDLGANDDASEWIAKPEKDLAEEIAAAFERGKAAAERQFAEKILDSQLKRRG